MIKEYIKQLAEQFPITWDRFTEDDGIYNIYGWIQKESGKRDFILLHVYIEDGEIKGGFDTSSAKYSEAIYEFLYGKKEGHVKCHRIETLVV